ncbi:MAG: 3'-5' exonuclease [Clostridia bacterium]|nr:3'-5' exonuclease [Clostridia bacterium]
MIIYFDTETTGLTPGRIVQLSYIIDYGDSIKAKNFFFAVEYVPPEVVAVHGFSAEKLAVLSGGKTFSDHIDEIENDFSSADVIVAHNVSFDIKFLSSEFAYQDRLFKYNKTFDTMKYFCGICKIPRANHKGYKYPKLSELCDYLDVYPYDITRETIKLFNNATNFHDARYDTSALYLSVKTAMQTCPQIQNDL